MSDRNLSVSSVKSLSLQDILGTAKKTSEKFTVVLEGLTFACTVDGSADDTIEALAELVSGSAINMSRKASVGGITTKRQTSFKGVTGATLAPKMVAHLEPQITVTQPANKPNGQPVASK